MRDAKGRFCKARTFKVGDRVVLNTDWAGEIGSRGEAGKVDQQADTEGYVKVLFDSYTWSGLSRLYCLSEWLEHETAKLKKGDHFTIEGVEGVQVAGKEYKSRKPRKPATNPEPTIAPGAVVRLKSGGPDMTAVLVEGDMVSCFWICDHKKPCEYILPVSCLEFVR